MSLTCHCDFDIEPGQTYWVDPDDYSKLAENRRKRCRSCNTLIEIDAIVAKFNRFKVPDTDVEVAIHGEDGEIERAPHYLCEECADMHFNLVELGYCSDITVNQKDRVAEYAKMQRYLNQKVSCPKCNWTGFRRDVDGSDYCAQCLHVKKNGLVKLEPTT